MARADITGMFWNDEPPPKPPKKEKPKRTPPEPIWLRPDYLPHLEEAKSFSPNLFTDAELILAAENKERLVWDIECYPNYFLVAFKSVSSGKSVYFERSCHRQLDISKLLWVLGNFTLIDFNGNRYDLPIVSLAVANRTTEDLFAATDEIINQEIRPYMVLRSRKVKQLQVDHIDLIELVSGDGSLKLLGGRLHVERMQDLPFKPGTELTEDQITITRWYCFNDLSSTQALYEELLPDIQLREKMGIRYGLDLRSHSDAQIAEAVLSSQIKQITGQQYIQRPSILPGTFYKYKAPHFIKYQTPLMQWVLETVINTWLVVGEGGGIDLPKELSELKITIGNAVYRMGIGGLHSSEKTISHHASDEIVLCDRDVESFYPRIILVCGLAPEHLGRPFLTSYAGIVEERLQAKHLKIKVTADGLKIVVNGSFGKLGNKYSILYSPDLLIQVTLTGQLSLLMLIERLELAGYPVISANTDGIVIKYNKNEQEKVSAIVEQWEKETGFKTEETFYRAVYSRDVNNYFAVKKDGGDSKKRFLDEQLGVKVKGVYAERGSARNSILAKNPTVQICSDAVLQLITTGQPVEKTIRECKDIRRFVMIRTVRGGAVWNGEYLGKAVRWYYAGETGEMVYALSGNKVPRSDGAKPLMQLPKIFPEDVDYEWYERETYKILTEIGYN